MFARDKAKNKGSYTKLWNKEASWKQEGRCQKQHWQSSDNGAYISLCLLCMCITMYIETLICQQVALIMYNMKLQFVSTIDQGLPAAKWSLLSKSIVKASYLKCKLYLSFACSKSHKRRLEKIIYGEVNRVFSEFQWYMGWVVGWQKWKI